MKYHSSYLVCHDHILEVKDFLAQFLPEDKGQYNHDGWVTFKFPGTGYEVSLMKGSDQKLTQNMTFEISCDDLAELEGWANRFGIEVDSFLATETGSPYRYHYIEIFGPAGICKVEVNYIETQN